MLFRLPQQADKGLLQQYVKEHGCHNETGISASLGLASEEYSQWLKKIHHNANEGNAEWGKSLLYLCFDEEKLVGLLSIRYQMPQALSQRYGDIGYGVRPTERNKGYATRMLAHALAVCKEKGRAQVLLGCYKDNIASAKTILKNGGILTEENENYQQGKTSQFYVIYL